jgi:hypothetical protein
MSVKEAHFPNAGQLRLEEVSLAPHFSEVPGKCWSVLVTVSNGFSLKAVETATKSFESLDDTSLKRGANEKSSSLPIGLSELFH